MNYNKISNRELIIILFIVFAAIIRLIPHPPNFAPITAMALFGGVLYGVPLGYIHGIISREENELYYFYYNEAKDVYDYKLKFDYAY